PTATETAGSNNTEIAAIFTVGAQTITYTSTTPTSASVGSATYTAAATGGASGNPVTISTATPAVCTATTGSSPVVFTFIATGTCTVDANQAGTGIYGVAPQAQ